MSRNRSRYPDGEQAPAREVVPDGSRGSGASFNTAHPVREVGRYKRATGLDSFFVGEEITRSAQKLEKREPKTSSHTKASVTIRRSKTRHIATPRRRKRIRAASRKP